MNCPSCGTDLPEAAKFCGSCGYQMTEPASPSAAPMVASGGMGGDVMTIEQAAAHKPQLAVGDLLKESWELAKPNLGILIGGALVLGLIMGVSQFTFIGPLLIAGPLYAGMSIAGLRIVNGAPLEFGNFFDGFKMFVPLMLLGLVMGALSTLGMMLLILPGLYLMMAWGFAPYLVIDRGEEFWPAMMGSMKVWNANAGFLIVWLLAMMGLTIVAAIPCYLGLIILGPVGIVAQALLYKKLFGVAGGAERIGT